MKTTKQKLKLKPKKDILTIIMGICITCGPSYSLGLISYLVGYIFMQHQRKHLFGEFLLWAFFVFTAIYENIVLSRVRMHVTVHENATVVGQSFDHCFCVPNGRIRFPNDRSVLSIQIFARQRATRVAHNYTVRIQHWYYFKNEFVSQFVCHKRIACDEVHQSFHHPRCRRFARMHTCTNHNGTFPLNGREIYSYRQESG